ncbi:MAG: ACT domain-containing protein [Candidatus Micrarchaeia archaeon]
MKPGKTSGKNLAIITAVGRDRTGLVAGISKTLADNKINIEDLSQTIMQDMFAMILLVDTSKSPLAFEQLREKLRAEGKKTGLDVSIQHKKIFEYMHRI